MVLWRRETATVDGHVGHTDEVDQGLSPTQIERDPGPVGARGARRILVVDDEPQIRRTLELNLAARGYDVDLATTGEQALELASRRHPDLVVLDLGLPGLDDTKPGLVDSDLRQGHVTLVNVFASWCQPCHVEHEFLLVLANDPALKAAGVTLVGVAQKDSPENIRRFLGAAGDPYAKVGLDSEGRAGIDWGVYGVPETFIVRGDGVIAYKVIGPISAETLESVVKPEIAKAMK